MKSATTFEKKKIDPFPQLSKIKMNFTLIKNYI